MIHAKKHYMKIRISRVGPGGWHCTCCGPSPRYRKAYVRMMNRIERRMFAKYIKNEDV